MEPRRGFAARDCAARVELVEGFRNRQFPRETALKRPSYGYAKSGRKSDALAPDPSGKRETTVTRRVEHTLCRLPNGPRTAPSASGNRSRRCARVLHHPRSEPRAASLAEGPQRAVEGALGASRRMLHRAKKGRFGDLNSGPLPPKGRIMPLDQTDSERQRSGPRATRIPSLPFRACLVAYTRDGPT